MAGILAGNGKRALTFVAIGMVMGNIGSSAHGEPQRGVRRSVGTWGRASYFLLKILGTVAATLTRAERRNIIKRGQAALEERLIWILPRAAQHGDREERSGVTC